MHSRWNTARPRVRRAPASRERRRGGAAAAAHLAAHAGAAEAVDVAAAGAALPQLEGHREVADADLLAGGDAVQRAHAHVRAARAAVVGVVDARRVRQAVVVDAGGVLVQRGAADAAAALRGRCLLSFTESQSRFPDVRMGEAK